MLLLTIFVRFVVRELKPFFIVWFNASLQLYAGRYTMLRSVQTSLWNSQSGWKIICRLGQIKPLQKLLPYVGPSGVPGTIWYGVIKGGIQYEL